MTSGAMLLSQVADFKSGGIYEDVDYGYPATAKGVGPCTPSALATLRMEPQPGICPFGSLLVGISQAMPQKLCPIGICVHRHCLEIPK